LGVHKLKLTVNDHTKVSLKEDDPAVPYMEDFCITVRKLTEVAVGDEVRVICLVKDEGEVESFASKDGKPLRKKLIVLCDPVDKVEVEMTLWNDDCGLQFECYPYMIKGIQVKEYQGTRQYSLRFNNRITILKQHPLRKYIKDMPSISFTNPDSNKKPRRTAISTLHELNSAMDEVTSSGTWSEAVCFLTSMRFGKSYYIGCPKCKKKVVEEEDSKCNHCGQEYSHAQYRYVLSINVADYTDSLWVNAYDEAGEALLGMPAVQFAKLDEDAFQSHMKKVRYRHKKLRMVTKDQEYNGNTTKKTTVIKVVDVNYAEETKILLEKVKHLIGK
jgi:replication factor A1